MWWGEYPAGWPAWYLSLDSSGRVFSPGLVESPGPERSMLVISEFHPSWPPERDQRNVKCKQRDQHYTLHNLLPDMASPEGIKREPDGFLLRHEGAS